MTSRYGVFSPPPAGEGVASRRKWQASWWLTEGDERSEAHKLALGHPLEEPLKIYPVSDLVNSPKTDDAHCIEPAVIDRDFFKRQWWGDA
jgi:hypothetical protein